MLQLTYISTVTAIAPSTVAVDVLVESRRNNRAAGVTGLLLFNGRRFLQALEGDEQAVRAIYARILGDPRHKALVKLSERIAPTREFGDWDMAYPQDSNADALADAVDKLTNQVPNPLTRDHFRSFARVRAA